MTTTMKNLVDEYNTLLDTHNSGQPHVKKFQDIKTGQTRLEALKASFPEYGPQEKSSFNLKSFDSKFTPEPDPDAVDDDENDNENEVEVEEDKETEKFKVKRKDELIKRKSTPKEPKPPKPPKIHKEAKTPTTGSLIKKYIFEGKSDEEIINLVEGVAEKNNDKDYIVRCIRWYRSAIKTGKIKVSS